MTVLRAYQKMVLINKAVCELIIQGQPLQRHSSGRAPLSDIFVPGSMDMCVSETGTGTYQEYEGRPRVLG